MENNFKNTEWKYIVYETSNKINNKIYIGVHKTKNPFSFDGYIGCGVYVTQPYTYQYAKTAFQYAVKKYGPKNFIRKTLAIFDTEEEAYLLEEHIVNDKFLARNDVYNMVLGGIGGCLKSEKIKVYQYDLKGNYMQEHCSMADAALAVGAGDYTLISYAIRKKAIAKNSFWSTDKVNKINLDNYNLGNTNYTKISIYDINGNFIETMKSITSLSKKYNLSFNLVKKSSILGICLNNKFYTCFLEAKNYSIARSLYIKNRPVFKYDSNGNFICEYESQAKAEKLNPESNINKSIKLKELDKNGYMWSVEKTEKYNVPLKRSKKRVGKFDLNLNLIKEYDSATRAAKENGTSVWKVLTGTNKTHKGYIYKYLQS